MHPDKDLNLPRLLYIKYMKGGKLFVPPSGSKFVLSVTVDVTGSLTVDQFVSSVVTGTLIAHGIRPEPFEITWSEENPYPPVVH
jgi:hypothetical protein